MTRPVAPQVVSWSSLVTAAHRAAETTRSRPLFDDPMARAVLARTTAPRGAGPLLFHLDGSPTAATAAMGDYEAVRTHFFDQRLVEAVAAGTRQVVVLGAGLDGRAYRLPGLARCRWFEVDSAANVAFKREVVATTPSLRAVTEPVTVVADAAHDWPGPLRAAGYDPSAPAVFLVEGLLVCLSPAAGDDLVDRIHAHACRGSTVVGDYPGVDAHEIASRVPTWNEAVATRPHGPVEPPERWLRGRPWDVDAVSFAGLGLALDRSVPAHLDPAVGGDDLWLFSAVAR